MAAPSPFVWGKSGGRDALSTRRRMAEALMKSGMDYSPVQHWTQGASRLAQALLGAYETNQIDKQEKDSNEAIAQALAGSFGGSAGAMAAPSPGAAATGAAPVAPASLMPRFAQAEAQYGLPKGYLTQTASIESGFNPSAKNPNSSASGLFQFVNGTARQYGLTNPFDPAASTDAAARLAADNKAHLTRTLGREPTAGELYLAHQQGAGGAAKLLSNPNARAVDVVGLDAVRLNGGDPNMTAGQFAQRWVGKLASADMPAPGAAPASAETRQEGFAVPPAPGMSGDTFNAVTASLDQPAPQPSFQSVGMGQPWMGTALAPQAQPAAPAAPDPVLADAPAAGATEAIGRIPEPIAPQAAPPVAPPVGVDPNSPDAGVRALQAGDAGATVTSPMSGIVQALSGQQSGAGQPQAASPSVSPGMVQALAPSPSASAPTDPRARLAMALARSGRADEAIKLAMDATAPVNGVTMGDRLVDPRTGRVIADFTGANGGRSTEYGLNPVYGVDKDGKTVIMQVGKRGDAVATRMPEGVSLASGVDRIDLGTQWGLMDKRTGQMVGTLPKDVAGQARESKAGTLSAEKQAEAPQAKLSFDNSIYNLDRLASEAKALRNHKGLPRITGSMGMVPNWAGSNAANAQAKLETLKSQIGFGVLQAMREASKTGGALGSVSNEEGRRLENNLAALAQSQSLEEFQKNLDQIIAYADSTKGRLTDAYRQSYPGAAPPAPQAQAGGWQDIGGFRVRRKQ